MKTIIIYNDYEKLRYAIVEGDWSRFNKVIFNSIIAHDYMDECAIFLFDERGYLKHEFTEEIDLLESKLWDKAAVISFIP